MTLTNEEIAAIHLPKWSGLFVDGKSVTKEQAAEIILRTDNSIHNKFMCNDHDWEKLCQKIVGLPKDADDRSFSWQACLDRQAYLKNQLGVIRLSYLTNSRIASSYIGGPHGWIDWQGSVGCKNYNIGKWPSTTDVFEDLQLIAKTWPFLEMTVQLLSGEACELDGKYDDPIPVPVIEYHVSKGNVTAHKPGKMLEPFYTGSDSPGFDLFRSERGCSAEQLSNAVDICRKVAGREV